MNIVKCIVKSPFGDTIGYGVTLNGVSYQNKAVEELRGITFDNATFVNNKHPFLRGKPGVNLSSRELKQGVRLYHGSDVVVSHPEYGKGKRNNDYGQGFYTTMVKDKGEEWALLKRGKACVCNEYCLNTEGLCIIDLDRYNPLAWIAVVLKHRGVGSATGIDYSYELDLKKFIEKYSPDLSRADVVIGYRADDSYFAIVEAFVAGYYSAGEVISMFHEGYLGRQVFIKSPKAFSSKHLQFVGSYTVNKRNLGRVQRQDEFVRGKVLREISQRALEVRRGRYKVKAPTFFDCVDYDYKYDKSRGGFYV